MLSIEQIDALVISQGFADFKWIDPQAIVVAYWVRMKCKFGCASYAKKATCPPNTPSVEDCQHFFEEYSRAIVLHFQMVAPDPAQRKTMNSRVNLELVKLENAIFMAGYPRAFMLLMAPCSICAECPPNRADCTKPEIARPTPEGMAIDVFTTVRKLGYPIDVLTDTSQAMNRYAFLMID